MSNLTSAVGLRQTASSDEAALFEAGLGDLGNTGSSSSGAMPPVDAATNADANAAANAAAAAAAA